MSYLVEAGLELGEDVGHGDYGKRGIRCDIRCGVRCGNVSECSFHSCS